MATASATGSTLDDRNAAVISILTELGFSTSLTRISGESGPRIVATIGGATFASDSTVNTTFYLLNYNYSSITDFDTRGSNSFNFRIYRNSISGGYRWYVDYHGGTDNYSFLYFISDKLLIYLGTGVTTVCPLNGYLYSATFANDGSDYHTYLRVLDLVTGSNRLDLDGNYFIAIPLMMAKRVSWESLDRVLGIYLVAGHSDLTSGNHYEIDGEYYLCVWGKYLIRSN